jgi:hypothetical protein
VLPPAQQQLALEQQYRVRTALVTARRATFASGPTSVTASAALAAVFNPRGGGAPVQTGKIVSGPTSRRRPMCGSGNTQCST